MPESRKIPPLRCPRSTEQSMKAFNLASPLQQLFSCCAFALLSFSAHAIVNMEQAIVGRPAAGLHTTVDMFIHNASGNTEKRSAKADLLTLFQHGEHTEFLQIQYAYGSSGGQADTDRAFAHLRHRTELNAGWSIEGFAQVGKDAFARLKQRTLAGGGLRRILFEKGKVSAGYLGLGAFHEQEVLSEQLGTSDPMYERRWRANSYLVLKQQFNEQVRVYNTLYYQPDVADTVDFRLLEQASVLVQMGQNLDLKLSLEISYDSRPPQMVQQRDVVYSTGLEFSF